MACLLSLAHHPWIESLASKGWCICIHLENSASLNLHVKLFFFSVLTLKRFPNLNFRGVKFVPLEIEQNLWPGVLAQGGRGESDV